MKFNLMKLICPSYYWKLYHNLHGEGVSVEDYGELDSENEPYQPTYCCQDHYQNHFKKLSLREMKILEPEELKFAEDNEDAWRMILLLDGEKAWKEINTPELQKREDEI